MTVAGSQPEGTPHQLLARLAGAWAGTLRTWFEPDGVPSDARIQGSIQRILDGRFALYLYQSVLQGETLHGMFTFGYNTTLDRYEAAWIDSFHNNTTIMFCIGEGSQRGFWVRGSYPDPSGGPDWSWRTEVSLETPDRLVITAYNISPEGLESKATMSELERLPDRN